MAGPRDSAARDISATGGPPLPRDPAACVHVLASSAAAHLSIPRGWLSLLEHLVLEKTQAFTISDTTPVARLGEATHGNERQDDRQTPVS